MIHRELQPSSPASALLAMRDAEVAALRRRVAELEAALAAASDHARDARG